MTALFITGAESGIGRALVDRALKRGEKVIGSVYAEGSLTINHTNFLCVQMDVGQTGSVKAAFAKADAWLAGTPLDVVVNCAGYCPLGALEVVPMEIMEKTINTNAIGSARVLQESLPRLRGHDGRIILISSLWGKVAGPMLSAYCASKFAIEAIADSARRETHGQGVHICVVEPGVVRTPLIDGQIASAKQSTKDLTGPHKSIYSNLYTQYTKMIEKNAGGGLSADECAQIIEKAAFANKPKTRVRAGMDSKGVTSLGWLLSDRLLDGLFKQMLK